MSANALIGVILAQAAATMPLPEAGGLGAGINVDLMELGALQAFGAGGVSSGLRGGVAVQIDTGPRWALRFPVVIGSAPWGSGGFADISIVPGMLYRWRNDVNQRWIPFAGAGIKLGGWGAHREMLDQPLVAAHLARDLDDLDDGDGESDPNFEVNFGAGLELWGGAEWRPNKWVALNLQMTAFAVRVHAATVWGLAQTIGLRVSI